MKLEGKLKEYWGSEACLSLATFVEMMYKRNPGEVFECRILGINSPNCTGYFNDPVALAKGLLPLPESPREKIPYGDYPRITEANIYLTMNPVVNDLLARSANKFMRAKTGDGTSNEDIAAFNMFFIDLDPKRKSGISANESERREARKVWLRVRRDLRKRHLRPIPASSGNGYHVVILTKTYIGEDISRAAARGIRILEYIKHKFETDMVEVDTGVCTAAHLIKLYGSLAMKGSNLPERPHHYATIDIPAILPPDADIFEIYKDEIDAWEKEQQSAAVPATVTCAVSGDAGAKVEKSVAKLVAFLEYKKLKYKRIDNKPAIVVLAFEECPYHEGNKDDKYECCLTVSKKESSAGAWGASCQHDSTAGWKEFKVALGWDEYQADMCDADDNGVTDDESKKAKMLVDAPFTPLGYDKGTYYYYSKSTKQIVVLRVDQHREGFLSQLAPRPWFLECYGGEKEPKWKEIADDLIQQCHRKGVFRPEMFRGRGACWDDGRIVIYAGGDIIRCLTMNSERQVTVDKKCPLNDFKSRFTYEIAPAYEDVTATIEPLLLDRCKQILEIALSFSWRNKVSGTLLSGWCVIAPVCGAMPWRPHVHVTGPSGAGKSTVLNNFVIPLVGPASLNVSSCTTEAGIRQTIKNDAVPVAFDEVESENKQGMERVHKVLELFRQASSDQGYPVRAGVWVHHSKLRPALKYRNPADTAGRHFAVYHPYTKGE